MTVVLEPLTHSAVIYVEGVLRAPLNGELSQQVQARLCRGAPLIRLDLSRLSALDAAGVGELVRVFNMTSAAGRALEIAQPSARVTQLLDLAGVLSILAAETQA